MILVSAVQTSDVKCARFPSNKPALGSALSEAQTFAGAFRLSDRSWCAPQFAARQTAAALGLDPADEPLLADIDYGSWAGRAIKDVIATDCTGFVDWMRGGAPPQGEALSMVVTRARNWLTARLQLRGEFVAVMSSSMIRAVMMAALGAPTKCFARIDISPLTTTVLTSDGWRWCLQSSGCRLTLPHSRSE